jgi:hypothetical protein
MHRISGRPDNPAFFGIRSDTGFDLPDTGIRPDAGYGKKPD